MSAFGGDRNEWNLTKRIRHWHNIKTATSRKSTRRKYLKRALKHWRLTVSFASRQKTETSASFALYRSQHLCGTACHKLCTTPWWGNVLGGMSYIPCSLSQSQNTLKRTNVRLSSPTVSATHCSLLRCPWRSYVILAPRLTNYLRRT